MPRNWQASQPLVLELITAHSPQPTYSPHWDSLLSLCSVSCLDSDGLKLFLLVTLTSPWCLFLVWYLHGISQSCWTEPQAVPCWPSCLHSSLQYNGGTSCPLFHQLRESGHLSSHHKSGRQSSLTRFLRMESEPRSASKNQTRQILTSSWKLPSLNLCEVGYP